MSYRYPDTTDRITAAYIDKHEPYPGYWQESEQQALALAGIQIAEKLHGKEIKALDAGCGDGRLLSWLGRYASTITVIDPDNSRLDLAKKQPDVDDVTFYQESIAEHKKASYDLILCSHIIQHMPSTEVVPTLGHLAKLTASGGLLALLYSRSPVGEEHYSLDSLRGDKVHSQKVLKSTFDAAFQIPVEPPVLPIHFFDPGVLASQARQLGWKEVWNWTFHAVEKNHRLTSLPNRDATINGDPELRQKFGRDMLVLWQRH